MAPSMTCKVDQNLVYISDRHAAKSMGSHGDYRVASLVLGTTE
jgi:hypothetical protein